MRGPSLPHPRALSHRFTHHAAIDWSGASGHRHKGLAVALIGAGDEAPALIRPGHIWSRQEVLEWVVHESPPETLIGFDLGQSLPFADTGAFFPGWDDSPATARDLWALVDRLCADEPDLGVGAFVDHLEASRHFRRHGGRAGDLFPAGRGRMRVTEHAQARAGCQPTSNFNLVGASQVGKGSLSGMRLFHRLPRGIAVWPMDPVPAHGRVVVEIYTTIAAMAAGRAASRSKIRTQGDLARALAALGCTWTTPEGPVADHAADALVTAAWLRMVGARQDLWHPPALTAQLAQTEGWTFGVA
jgi:hypothetical protein